MYSIDVIISYYISIFYICIYSICLLHVVFEDAGAATFFSRQARQSQEVFHGVDCHLVEEV